jgi:hypothetical protein
MALEVKSCSNRRVESVDLQSVQRMNMYFDGPVLYKASARERRVVNAHVRVRRQENTGILRGECEPEGEQGGDVKHEAIGSTPARSEATSRRGGVLVRSTGRAERVLVVLCAGVLTLPCKQCCVLALGGLLAPCRAAYRICSMSAALRKELDIVHRIRD